MNEFAQILDQLIDISIQKVFTSGVMVHEYWVNKGDLNRQRVTSQLVFDCKQLAEERGVECDYLEHRGAFNITVNLNHCRLSVTQSRALSDALAATYQG